MKNRAPMRQRGVTTLVVLLLMTVMLLAGLAMARIVESGVLVGGNVATREASIHASEVGWNTAYDAVKTLANENANLGSWYRATMQLADVDGIPNVDWSATPTVSVGRYTVTYAVERMCTVAILTARDHLGAQGARVLGAPKIGAHGKPVVFLHPKDFNGCLIELEQV